MNKESKPLTKENLSLYAMIVFKRAERTISNITVRNIKKMGLTLTQFGVLEVLHSKGELKICELIEKMLSTSGNMTVVIKNMERNGWIYRNIDKKDKRSFVVGLTEQGKNILKVVFPEHVKSVETAFNVLTDEEKKTLICILKKFKKLEEKNKY
ncbi:MarR family transcriptional regulator [Leptotrichia sp. OH3620_COT-345]|uniref:MarR family winged helix-turn-helix transcriptional regulator n=1 Tax=Leptotrichia sp. OH3620_COT-345 TaxID=2491048 RepID=UPI000F647A05|nr:MarR family transcriptional regulator [Leptotrichia sp. OH3620_COT-345]RRD39338.1 MarR family transcriptional regulator [Leptotrichia sp. OH3620_COT-345]